MKGFPKSLANMLALLCLLLFSACGGGDADLDAGVDSLDVSAMDTSTISSQEEMAVAQLQPTQGNNVTGTVQFVPADDGVRVIADIQGLQPGEHGIHVHEFGDCSAPDGSSAGGHYTPEGTPHGAPTDPAPQRHTGDLGNLEASDNGEAHYERVDEVLTLSGPNSVVGKAVVVHADRDDLESQPSGNAGARVACGVIQMGAAGMPSDTMMTDTSDAGSI